MYHVLINRIIYIKKKSLPLYKKKYFHNANRGGGGSNLHKVENFQYFKH